MRKRLAVAIVAATILGWQVSATPDGAAQFVSETRWSQSEDWFGGFSAIEVSNNGTQFLALSDRGHLLEGTLKREAGRLESVEISLTHIVRDGKGNSSQNLTDSEGLALRTDGGLFVSFEGSQKVQGYAELMGAMTELPRHKDFKKMRRNGSLEALAVDDQNQLYTLPESTKDSLGLPVYRFQDGYWVKAFYLTQSEGFDPVGADFGPDGKFYLLERKFAGLGFQSRVRRFEFTAEGALDEELLLQTPIGEHDNLEGLSVWADAKGGIRLTMISDDNFNFFQRTEIIEYRLPSNGAGEA